MAPAQDRAQVGLYFVNVFRAKNNISFTVKRFMYLGWYGSLCAQKEHNLHNRPFDWPGVTIP